MIKDVLITKLDVIDAPGGDVMHAIKKTSDGYSGFGEAYFSKIESGAIKAWKRHRSMTLNLVVPIGRIKFVLYDDREAISSQLQKVIISEKEYFRLTIPPMIWVGFQGLSSNESMLLNIANMEHDPSEADRLDLNDIDYNWSTD